MLGSLWERGKLKLAVDSATSTADEPTPIYVLDELVQALGAGDSRAGVDAVCARLAHRSPIVKQKALKLVAHIGRKGSPDVRRLMARHSGAVRDLLHFRCEPDPFKGDTVWKRVQEYAQEALNAIHGEPEAAAPSSSGLRGRIQGFGSEAAGGYSGGGSMMGFGSESAGGYSGGGGGGGSSGRMVGFGSADVMQSGMQAISSGMRTLSGGRYDDYSSAQLDGGSAYSGGYSGTSSRTGGGGLSQGPIIQAGAVAAAATPASSGTAAGGGGAGGAAEQRAVDRICTPAGLRTAPSREDLRAFVDAIASLDGTAVALLLQRKLEVGPWQASLRALCAIDVAVESSSQAACSQVAAHFKAHLEAVRAAADSPQASVRQRAQKLLGALGGGAAAPAAPGSDSAAAGQPLFTEDLLGEADGSTSGPSTAAAGLADLLGQPAAAQAPASSGASGGADWLAGLDVPAAAAAPSQPPPQPGAAATAAAARRAAPDDLFSGMLMDSQPVGSSAPPAAAAPVAPAAPASASSLDLLGGLSLGGPSSSSAPAPMPAAAAPPIASAAPAALGFDDLLGGLSLGSAPAAPAMGSASANGAAGGFPAQPAGGMPGGPLGGGSAGWAAAPMGSTAQPSLGGAPAGLVPQGVAMGGSGNHGPFHQPGPAAALGGLQGLHLAHQPPARLPSLGSLGSGPLPAGALAHSGILDSQRDNAFNFVDDALAAAKRKQ